MRVSGSGIAIFALALSCGFPRPERLTGDGPANGDDAPMTKSDAPSTISDATSDAASDATSDAPPPGGDDFTGGISSGGGILQSGTVAILDDGLEYSDWACGGTTCVSGGIAP
jgi:hypothetical protein